MLASDNNPSEHFAPSFRRVHGRDLIGLRRTASTGASPFANTAVSQCARVAERIDHL